MTMSPPPLTFARRRRAKWCTAALVLATGGGAALAAAFAVALAAHRSWPPPPPSIRRVLVLGCAPGPALSRRVRAAVRLSKDRHLVFSGRGEASPALAQALREGLSPDQAAVEPNARSTLENLLFGATPGEPFLLVTDALHLPRALFLAQRLGLMAHPVSAGGPASRSARGRFAVREGLSWMALGFGLPKRRIP